MASIDELLDSAVVEQSLEDKSVIQDVNEYLEIDPVKRQVIIPNDELIFGVQHDLDGERKHFKVARYVGNNLDMSKAHIYINYTNAEGDPDSYVVTDATIEGDTVKFSWVLSSRATAYKGDILFVVCARWSTSDGTETNRWHTTLARGINLEGLETEPIVLERYPDIFEQLLNMYETNVKKQLIYNSADMVVNLKSMIYSGSSESYSVYKGNTLVSCGDSIVAGWGWQEGTGFFQPLKEKYKNATWINKAESGANMAVTTNPKHIPIVKQIKSLTGKINGIMFDGGVNDANNGIHIGSVTGSYDSTFDESTFCGALESAIQFLMNNYPLAVKFFVLPYRFSKDDSYLSSVYDKSIEICEKWEMPYIDFRKYGQLAMTTTNKNKYTRNPNTGVADSVHRKEKWYRTFGSPIIDSEFRFLGIGYQGIETEPTIVKVSGVKLNITTLELRVGDIRQLKETVLPTNATDKSVIWSVDNSNVSVYNGKVTANKVGNSIVTVKTVDGNYKATCSVTIREQVVEEHTELESVTLDGNCYFDTELLADINTNTEQKISVKSGSTYLFGA